MGRRKGNFTGVIRSDQTKLLSTKVGGSEVGKCEASKGVKDGQEGIFGSRASEKRRRGKERVYSKE